MNCFFFYPGPPSLGLTTRGSGAGSVPPVEGAAVTTTETVAAVTEPLPASGPPPSEGGLALGPPKEKSLLLSETEVGGGGGGAGQMMCWSSPPWIGIGGGGFKGGPSRGIWGNKGWDSVEVSMIGSGGRGGGGVERMETGGRDWDEGWGGRNFEEGGIRALLETLSSTEKIPTLGISGKSSQARLAISYCSWGLRVTTSNWKKKIIFYQKKKKNQLPTENKNFINEKFNEPYCNDIARNFQEIELTEKMYNIHTYECEVHS